MPPIREYLCHYCNHHFEELVYSQDPDEYQFATCRCGSRARVLPALIGGYNGSTGGSSTRPQRSGAMPSKKVYTGYEDLPQRDDFDGNEE